MTAASSQEYERLLLRGRCGLQWGDENDPSVQEEFKPLQAQAEADGLKLHLTSYFNISHTSGLAILARRDGSPFDIFPDDRGWLDEIEMEWGEVLDRARRARDLGIHAPPPTPQLQRDLIRLYDDGILMTPSANWEEWRQWGLALERAASRTGIGLHIRDLQDQTTRPPTGRHKPLTLEPMHGGRYEIGFRAADLDGVRAEMRAMVEADWGERLEAVRRWARSGSPE